MPKSFPPSGNAFATSGVSIPEASNAFRKDSERHSEVTSAKRLSSLRVAPNSKTYKLPRKLALSRVLTECTVTCAKTGIVSLMALPAIPGFTLISEHPLAQIDNARGIAQRGRNYLSLLEKHVLAGIFLTLASEYELLRKTKSDGFSGVSDNAVLRTLEKTALVEAILMVENWIHSGNSIYIPRFSLLPQSGESVQSIAGRLTEWLKLVHDAIYAPDTTVYNPKAKPEKIVFDSMKPIRVKQKEKNTILLFKKKELRTDCKTLKELGATLKDVSPQLKSYVLAMASQDMLLSADPELLSMMAFKLSMLETVAGNKIAEILKRDRSVLRNEGNDLFGDDVESNDSAEGATNPPTQAQMRNTAVVQNDEIADILIAQQSSPDSSEPEPDYAGMNSVQKIIARKAWLKRTGRYEAARNAEIVNAVYSIPSGTIVGKAPEYKPTADKEKLAGNIVQSTGDF